MPKVRITMMGYLRERSPHEWDPRIDSQEPRACPKCKSPHWNIPRKPAGVGRDRIAKRISKGFAATVLGNRQGETTSAILSDAISGFIEVSTGRRPSRETVMPWFQTAVGSMLIAVAVPLAIIADILSDGSGFGALVIVFTVGSAIVVYLLIFLFDSGVGRGWLGRIGKH